MVQVDVFGGGFIWWQAIPNATANTKGDRINEEVRRFVVNTKKLTQYLLIRHSQSMSYQFTFSCGTIAFFYALYESSTGGVHFDACRRKRTLIFYGGVFSECFYAKLDNGGKRCENGLF